MGAPYGTGSRASHEADKSSSPKASIPSAAMPLRAASDDVWHELDELRAKLRMIISHASGGALSKPNDIDRSVNDICVRISAHNNRIWQHAQEVALRDASAIEARSDETRSGSAEGESAVGDSRDAQDTSHDHQ